MKTKPKATPAPEIETPEPAPSLGDIAYDRYVRAQGEQARLLREDIGAYFTKLLKPKVDFWAIELPPLEAVARRATPAMGKAESMGFVQSVIEKANAHGYAEKVKKGLKSAARLMEGRLIADVNTERHDVLIDLEWKGVDTPAVAYEKDLASLEAAMQARAEAEERKVGLPAAPAVRPPDPSRGPREGTAPAITEFNPMEGPSWPIR